MNTLYLDIFSGISGDMFIGALIDLGVDAHQLEHELGKLGLSGYHLHVSRQQRGTISGTKFDVHLEGDHHHEHEHDLTHTHRHEHGHQHHSHGKDDHDAHDQRRTFADIRRLILGSGLSPWVKEKAVSLFQRVAVAEGKIHGQPPEKVHFHEVGAVDSIVDIAGACVALELLGKPRVLAGPVQEGVGTVNCAHGRFPLPAPATLEILSARGAVIQQTSEPHELITPTGAALLAEFAEDFGPMQNLMITRIGYGLGSRENKTRPNVLRAVLGEAATEDVHDWETDTITVLETNLDDINAEILGDFVEKALSAGALDVFHTPVQMKKNRPGVLLTVLSSVAEADKLTELLLRETTAFGVRRSTTERRKLRREVLTVKTSFGEVAVKLGRLDGRVIQAAPEFESCKKLAEQANVPLKQVYEAATRAAQFDL